MVIRFDAMGVVDATTEKILKMDRFKVPESICGDLDINIIISLSWNDPITSIGTSLLCCYSAWSTIGLGRI